MYLRQKGKWWKRLNPALIERQNNYHKIKEILTYNNKLDATVSKHMRGKRKEYSFSRESYDFSKQLDFTRKEIDIKDDVIESATNKKEEAKVQTLKSIKKKWE